MPQFINCRIEPDQTTNQPSHQTSNQTTPNTIHTNNTNNNSSSQTSPGQNLPQINYSHTHDEIAAAMTLIDLSASPRSIAKRMLAEDLVTQGLNFPNNGDSQQAQKAQAEVANNLVQQIKRKREAVAMQQHILSKQIMQQTQMLQRLSSNDMDTSENGAASEMMQQAVQNFVINSNSTKNLVGSTNNLLTSAQQFQNLTGSAVTTAVSEHSGRNSMISSQAANQNLINNNPPNPFNRQNSQLTTNTEEINVDSEEETNNHVDLTNQSNNQQLNASQAQLLLARIQHHQKQPLANQDSDSLRARIAIALNQQIQENDEEEQARNVEATLPQINSPNSDTRQFSAVNLVQSGSLSTSQNAIITNITNVTGHSPMQHSPLQLQPTVTTSDLFPKVIFKKNGQLTVRANQLLPHSAPGLNTNPINIGNGKVILAQNNGNFSNQIIGDSLLTNSCLSGSPVNMQPVGAHSPNFQNVQNLQNKGFQQIHNVQSLQTLKNIQNIQNVQKTGAFFNNGQNLTVLKMPTFVQSNQNIQNVQPSHTTTFTSTNNSNNLQMYAQQNQILQILQHQKMQEQQNQQINQHPQSNSQSSTNTHQSSARGTLANTPITTANGVIINQLLSKTQLISNNLKSGVVKSLPVLNNGGSYSAMSPQIGKNGQILNPLMSTGGFMKHTVGGPMEVTPRSRTTSTGATSGRKRGDSKKCRKVYGIEHKDNWCKACIWKKACQRYPD